MSRTIQIVIERTKEDDSQTQGELVIYDNKQRLFECKVLELPWRDNKRRVSRIPEGHYPAQKHISPNFGKSIWIKDVPDRSEILIHVGNFIGNPNPKTGKPDSLGCPIVGESFSNPGTGIVNVTNSRKTINALYETLNQEDNIFVNIINKF